MSDVAMATTMWPALQLHHYVLVLKIAAAAAALQVTMGSFIF